MNRWKHWRNRAIGAAYRSLLKPIFFRQDPETVHDRMIVMGSLLGTCAITRTITRWAFGFTDPRLSQTLHGITFPNPIGLAGGFDKNAKLINILPDVGFGFHEIGSITAKPYAGNPGRHLWRLPKTRALVVNYGLKNDGADAIAERIRTETPRIPMGINIAKTNNAETCDRDVGIQDYAYTHNLFQNIGQFDTINVSCPNAFGGQPFHEASRLEALLQKLNLRSAKKPAFIKISPDLEPASIDAIVDLCVAYGAAGIICTNLTKQRDATVLKDADVPSIGGISGKAVSHLTDETLRRIYRRSQGKLTLVGLGGIFSAEDAYRKIRLGASLVELITGMIYEGPQLVSSINMELVELLERDGFKHLSEAIGVDA